MHPLNPSVIAATQQHPDDTVPATQSDDDRHLSKGNEARSKKVYSAWILLGIEVVIGAKEKRQRDEKKVNYDDDDRHHRETGCVSRTRSVEQDAM